MASSLIVTVAEVSEVKPHPNADTLDLVIVKGWQCVAKRVTPPGSSVGFPRYSVGERVVYIPPDAEIPLHLAEKLGVTGYLSERTNENGDRVLVTRPVKLRGEASFGILAEPAAVDVDYYAEPEEDWADRLGIKKFLPLPRGQQGQPGIKSGLVVPDHPDFHQYTGLENARNYPHLFERGEDVVVTEKIHGTNSRVGLIDGEFMAGSHRMRRAGPDTVIKFTYDLGLINGEPNVGEMTVRPGRWWFDGDAWKFRTERHTPYEQLPEVRWLDIEATRVVDWGTLRKPPEGVPTKPMPAPDPTKFIDQSDSTYWFPLTIPGVKELLTDFHAQGYTSVVLYGEIAGAKVQDLHYGNTGDNLGYYAFDLKVDGQYVDNNIFEFACSKHGIPTAPLLYKGPFVFSDMQAMAEGQSRLADHVREGVVVKPLQERHSPRLGRAILKFVGNGYLFRKNAQDCQDV